MLLATLASLLTEVRCVDAADIVVVQDGDNAEVTRVATASRVRVHRKLATAAGGGGPGQQQQQDGAALIATHYKYALGHALAVAFPAAPAVIVVEDDFLFSPDFYEYFHAVAPVI